MAYFRPFNHERHPGNEDDPIYDADINQALLAAGVTTWPIDPKAHPSAHQKMLAYLEQSIRQACAADASSSRSSGHQDDHVFKAIVGDIASRIATEILNGHLDDALSLLRHAKSDVQSREEEVRHVGRDFSQSRDQELVPASIQFLYPIMVSAGLRYEPLKPLKINDPKTTYRALLAELEPVVREKCECSSFSISRRKLDYAFERAVRSTAADIAQAIVEDRMIDAANLYSNIQSSVTGRVKVLHQHVPEAVEHQSR